MIQQHRQDIYALLKQYWGFDQFRAGQKEIIESILSGRDCLVLMPTGGGKSLCYQLPALAQEGLCLVISPLIALMKDQVENLRRKNITAFAIYSGMSRKEVIQTLRTATESNCKFLYVSPERLETQLFKEYLPALGVQLVAVDEAHCISQWGYDFRPPYLRIALLREELPSVPFLALTASATTDVQKDIATKLDLDQPAIFRQSFERPNLSYSVFAVDVKINKILEVLSKVPGPSIVYCRSRKRTREISDLLNLQQVSADFYHAGLTAEERARKQEDWLRNRTRVIVCTNAFGMGIDKPDVRTVIHADLPDCLESYYQEAGRAGRDRKTSFAVLLHDSNDIEELEAQVEARYPSMEEIRTVYQALANYLQIPSGEGSGEYFDFDINDFIRKFRLTGPAVHYALKALEQDGWLSFNEQVFLPATIRFTVHKDSLYAFEEAHPNLEPCIKTLLRTYEGIFDQDRPIYEKMIAGLLKIEPITLQEQLGFLHRSGIIDYRPQKDRPQLFLLRPRIRAEALSMDMDAYRERKRKALERVSHLKKYVTDPYGCRSRFVAVYFGDGEAGACGICDNCLRKKSIELTKEEFDTLQHRIINIIKYESLAGNELLEKLNGFKKEKTWKVLEFLEAENKIEVDSAGRVRLK